MNNSLTVQNFYDDETKQVFENFRNLTFDKFLTEYNNINKERIKTTQQLTDYKFSPSNKYRSSEFNNTLKLYEEYLLYKYTTTMSNSLYMDYIDYLNKGLIMSVDINTFIDYMKKFIDTLKIKYNIDYCSTLCKTPSVSILFFKNNFIKHKDKIYQYINKLGYVVFKEFEDNDEIKIFIEPKFLTDATDFIYNNKFVNKKLYHITLGARYNKIKNNGLIPKAPRKTKVYHEDKIFFFINKPDINKFKLIAYDLYKVDGNPDGEFTPEAQSVLDGINKNRKDKLNYLEIIALKITLDKPNINSRIRNRFFWDPNLRSAVYTYEPIHPAFIDIETTFNIYNGKEK